MADIIVNPEVEFSDHIIDAEPDGELMNRRLESYETQTLEEVDEVITIDLSGFAQVTYNFEKVQYDVIEVWPTAKELDRSTGNYCHLCRRTFINKCNSFNHPMKSHDKIIKSYACSYCNWTFRRQTNLTRHILLHAGEKPFGCSHCPRRFSRSDKLKLHDVSKAHTVRVNVPDERKDYSVECELLETKAAEELFEMKVVEL